MNALLKASLTATLATQLASATSINVIPKPNESKTIEGITFQLTAETAIRYDDALEAEAKLLQQAIKKLTNFQPKLYSEKLRIALPSHIHLDLNPSLDRAESYSLAVGDCSISIKGADSAGAFYGSQTLLQLIPQDGSNIILGCNISDAPRFGWRGMHLDVGRHMFAPKDIKTFIDWLAFHKLNSFHWHLTEDQGWRIEIKKHPKLTSVGAYRKSTPPYLNRSGSDGKRYGGFYTQEEIKDIVAYAKQRHITIVPEIDMPGHMAAAIASYPELGNDDIPNYAPEVKTHWGIHPYVLAPKESTFQWIDDVLTEVCELFPSSYIHIGGDEAPKDQWKASKFAQSVMQREGLKNEHELQSYFIKRVEKILMAKNRKLIGWDEIREGGLSPNATMMLWRGWEHAIASINEGHDVVMAPGSHTYFDHYQNNPEIELAKGPEFECIGGHRTLESVYSFDPVPAQFKGTDKAKHILGCQAQLWTEYMKTWDKVEYCAFPRIAALAECAWTQPENKEYADFYKRLLPTLERYKKAGVNTFDPTQANVFKVNDNSVTSTLSIYQKYYPSNIIDNKPDTYFWSSQAPKKGDHITITYAKKQAACKLTIHTGFEKNGQLTDTLQHGKLEYTLDGHKWQEASTFRADGTAPASLPAGVQGLRIVVTDDQELWLAVQSIPCK